MKKFRSHLFPKMNPFLELLGLALDALGIDCEGFYLAFYNSATPSFSSEKMGNVLPEEEISFMHFANYFIGIILLLGRKRSKNLADCKQGAIILYDNGASVNGRIDPPVAEAISALWLVAMNYLVNANRVNPMEDESFWVEFKQTANFAQRHTAPDNNFISGIAAEIEEQFKKKMEQSKRIQEAINA